MEFSWVYPPVIKHGKGKVSIFMEVSMYPRLGPKFRESDHQSPIFATSVHIPGLVNLQKAIENGHRNSGFSHSKWWIFP